MQIQEMVGIEDEHLQKLNSIGINTTNELLLSGARRSDRKRLAALVGVSSKLVLEWVNRADLMRINGVNGYHANMLENLGIDTVVEMARRNPDSLFRKIAASEIDQWVRSKPSYTEVVNWIMLAKHMDRMVCYSTRQEPGAIERSLEDISRLIEKKRLDLFESELISFLLYRFDPELDIYSKPGEVPDDINGLPNGSIFQVKSVAKRSARLSWFYKVLEGGEPKLESTSFKVPIDEIPEGCIPKDWLVNNGPGLNGKASYTSFSWEQLLDLLKARRHRSRLYGSVLSDVYGIIDEEIRSSWSGEPVTINSLISEGYKDVQNRFREVDFSRLPDGTLCKFVDQKDQNYVFNLTTHGLVSFGRRIIHGKFSLPREKVLTEGLVIDAQPPPPSTLSNCLKTDRIPRSAIGMDFDEFFKKYVDVQQYKESFSKVTHDQSIYWSSKFREKRNERLENPTFSVTEHVHQMPMAPKVSLVEFNPGCPLHVTFSDNIGKPLDISFRDVVPAGNSLSMSVITALANPMLTLGWVIKDFDVTIIDIKELYYDAGCCPETNPSSPYDPGWVYGSMPAKSCKIHTKCNRNHNKKITEWLINVKIDLGKVHPMNPSVYIIETTVNYGGGVRG